MVGIARISQTQLLQPFVALGAAALSLGEAIGWLGGLSRPRCWPDCAGLDARCPAHMNAVASHAPWAP
jgi:hypothetical protein